MSYTDIIIKTYELLDEFKDSTLYKEYLSLRDESKKHQALLDNYQKLKEKFENLEGGKYNPSFKEYASKLQDAKNAMFSVEVIKRLFVVETMLQQQLDEYSRQIGKAISDQIKTPNELGIVIHCKH